MATLTEHNTKVDPNSGAVLFKPSPELVLLKEIKEQQDRIEHKLDQLLSQREEGTNL